MDIKSCVSQFTRLECRIKIFILTGYFIDAFRCLALVKEAVGLLKCFKIVETVDESTTHVVCGDSRRTFNVMKGIVYGAKLVTLQWVSIPAISLSYKRLNLKKKVISLINSNVDEVIDIESQKYFSDFEFINRNN